MGCQAHMGGETEVQREHVCLLVDHPQHHFQSPHLENAPLMPLACLALSPPTLPSLITVQCSSILSVPHTAKCAPSQRPGPQASPRPEVSLTRCSLRVAGLLCHSDPRSNLAPLTHQPDLRCARPRPSPSPHCHSCIQCHCLLACLLSSPFPPPGVVPGGHRPCLSSSCCVPSSQQRAWQVAGTHRIPAA